MLLVVGYGNTLRSDDGFGPAVIACLSPLITDMPAVEIICQQQLLPEHAETLSRSSLVIFVDASYKGVPGQISCIELAPEPDKLSQGSPVVLPHSLSPSTLLTLCNDIYGCVPQAYLYTVGAASVGLGEILSPLVEQAVPQVVEMIFAQLALSDKHT
jgi:hydrogenase maturation protease